LPRCSRPAGEGRRLQAEQIAGYDAVTRNGGKVVVLDFHAGYSTTRLIDRMKASKAPDSPVPKAPAARGKSRV